LQERLRNRKTESESQIALRIAKATQELTKASEYDVVLVNTHLETVQKELYDLVWRFVNR
jgi:guanylate kinase